MVPFARIALALLLAGLWIAAPAPAWADDDDDSALDDDDAAFDDDDSGFYSGTVPLEDRVLGGGCEDGGSCSVAAGAASALPLLLFGLAAARRRR
jgi:MYXO-CTERM domain-containing protein